MKKTILVVTAACMWAAAAATAQEQPQEPKGKAVFQASKCLSCHSMETAGFKKKPNQKPPDLSTVGSKHTVEFLAGYLKKKEAIGGAKHMIAFKGSDEDFQALITWLASLKVEQK